ncbi:MAG TPA: 2Fe-2S iron-sulfur cluster-binding protein [Xanthobacteraceae bacterium]|jgi:2Fe-2S ferredoxin|nr:2Fe-2S iron-sulfur cluster-binding protein [Xanthobacteraceae bacterium]
MNLMLNKANPADQQEPDPDVLRVYVVDHGGREHVIEALEGWQLMAVIRDWGLGLKAECGGACACATCHVYVDQAWVDRLHPPHPEETDRLDDAFAVESNSRLACQILLSPAIDGLRVTLAPGTEVDR